MDRRRHYFGIYPKGSMGAAYFIGGSGKTCCGPLNNQKENIYTEFIIPDSYIKAVKRTQEDLMKWFEFITENTPFKMDFIKRDQYGDVGMATFFGIDTEEIGGGPMSLGAGAALRMIYNDYYFPNYDKVIYELHKKNPNESVLQCILYSTFTNREHYGYYAHIPGYEGIALPVTDEQLKERTPLFKKYRGMFKAFTQHYVTIDENSKSARFENHDKLVNKFKEMDSNITEFRKFLTSIIYDIDKIKEFYGIEFETDQNKRKYSGHGSSYELTNPLLSGLSRVKDNKYNSSYQFEVVEGGESISKLIVGNEAKHVLNINTTDGNLK